MSVYFHKDEQIIDIKKDGFLFHETDKIEYVYYLLEGIVKVIKYTEDGKEKIIDLLEKDDFIGVTLMMENKKMFGLSGIAVSDCKLVKVSVDGMFEALKNFEIMKKLMDFSTRKTLQLKNFVAMSIDSDERLMMVLQELFIRFGSIENGVKVINLPISKTDLANYIGLRRETLSRKLSYLKKKGIIDFDRNKIYIKKI